MHGETDHDNDFSRSNGKSVGPQWVALILIALGIGALVLATIQYQRQTRDLLREYPGYGPFPRSIAAGVAGIMSALGLLGFVLVMLRQ